MDAILHTYAGGEAGDDCGMNEDRRAEQDQYHANCAGKHHAITPGLLDKDGNGECCHQRQIHHAERKEGEHQRPAAAKTEPPVAHANTQTPQRSCHPHHLHQEGER